MKILNWFNKKTEKDKEGNDRELSLLVAYSSLMAFSELGFLSKVIAEKIAEDVSDEVREKLFEGDGFEKIIKEIRLCIATKFAKELR